MAGGLMQLVAYGAQDVYLTGNPQITFFKVVYRRHTNFSMETSEHPLNSSPDFGRKSDVIIVRNGDLIHEVYLMVTLQEVCPREGAKFAWVRRLGHAIIESVELDIGGSRIDRQYGIWFDIWFDLARPAGDLERGYAEMIGDVPRLTEYNGLKKKESILYIPLYFWFNRHVGLSLPLIALQYHEVRLHFEFRRAEELFVANKVFKDFCKQQVRMKEALILVNYIFLDSEERRRFAQVGHEYLIEQLQFEAPVSVTQNTVRCKLNFNHPTKELIWCLQNGSFTTGKAFLNYTHEDDWNECGPCGILHQTAVKILKESICLLDCAECDECSIDMGQNGFNGGECPPEGEFECFPPNCDPACTCNGKIRVTNNCKDKCLWINTSSLVIKKCKVEDGGNITGKICADVEAFEDECDEGECKISVSNVCAPGLSVRDLSFPVDSFKDTRCERDDPCVFQWNNCGVLIDGTGNPVDEALLQLNGHDRFDKRKGGYFNYVQPWQHHTNTPSDGINVYSFAINPEQHQPSGSANLSRIDNTILHLFFADPTLCPDVFGLTCPLPFLNADNKLYIFAVNYNVLRIMSGMGGLAYSN
uniref:Major capsid protein n=1 Tax=Mimivirus LCMiAC02 TaxID=2506609 RepID=A0A481Z0D5_9VIRU|nr:MAG: major capsid protein [Mimivirus LCMiAC02]